MSGQLTRDPSTEGSALLRRAENGERDAIEELYRSHKSGGIAYAKRRGAEDPEGVFDDVFVDVLTRLGTIGSGTAGEYRAYLFRSIRNRVIQQQRRHRPDLVELDENVEEPTVASFDDLVADRSLIASCLCELTTSQREVISRRFLGQERATEIAEAMDRSPESVRQLQRSALVRLRFLLSVGAAIIALVAMATIAYLLARDVDDAPTDPISSTTSNPVQSTTSTETSTPPIDESLQDASVVLVPPVGMTTTVPGATAKGQAGPATTSDSSTTVLDPEADGSPGDDGTPGQDGLDGTASTTTTIGAGGEGSSNGSEPEVVVAMGTSTTSGDTPLTTTSLDPNEAAALLAELLASLGG